MPPITAEAHPNGKLITIRYSGHVTIRDFTEVEAQLLLILKAANPGFTTLVDLSGLELMDLECGHSIAHIMDLSRDHGVGRVIRVMPDPSKDIGVNILSIIHYRGKVPIMTLETLAEAEKELL
jgi:anti-anti-sigma regulatory factor